MRYRQLGDSDLTVSEISLGTWLTFGVGIEREKAIASLDQAFDLGINFIDTANAYGYGAAESLLGEALKDRPRDSYILGTKVFVPMSETDYGLSRAQIEKQLDASLKRLNTDYVDLYQCHRYDVDTPLEETMEALTDAVKAGKVRYIGFSEWSPKQIQASLDLPGVEKFVSSQPQYSLLWRRPEKSASRNGRPSRSRLRWTCPVSRNSSPANHNIPCSGGGRKRRSFRCVLKTGFPRSSGRRWPRACCRASMCRAIRRRRTAVPPATR
ncbi:MAG: aldo/keto reductase [Maricaulis sp.]|nr:aldo/keto reductase [Maricaulis sp.]